MKPRNIIIVFGLFLFFSCEKENIAPDEDVITNDPNELYFPSINSNEWETISPIEQGYDQASIDVLMDFLELNNTRAFIILKDGKILMERYWGRTFTGGEFSADNAWYWASAGKTLTAFLSGIAVDNGFLDLDQSTSTYLGKWTNMPEAQEQEINVIHQLTMTTGLDYKVSNSDCTEPECLVYLNPPGTHWFYHNAPYTLMEQVISAASGISYNEFTRQHLLSKIGMEGLWRKGEYNNLFWSTARDAARFGLLLLNEGVWESERILEDQSFFESMSSSSQTLNPSYGYLTWLNGKERIKPPGIDRDFSTSLSPSAPEDLYAAMGKNGQFIDVVPSQSLVVIRMGEAPDDSLVPIAFHDEMWKLISAFMGLD